MNVFVCWRSSDREIKDRIVKALREGLPAEDDIWESDERCAADFSKECLEAVRKSHVFVIIVSDETMDPSYTLNELVEAKTREMAGELNIVVFKITDAPYSARIAANINHLSDVNHVARLRKDGSGIQSLVQKVGDLLEKRKKGTPEKPYEVFVPELDALPVSFGSYFVDHSRDALFDSVTEAFDRSNVVFFCQMSGYGKKSAAREYARLHRNEYSQILVLHQFSGTLREFFTVGVQIKNLNQKAFDSLSDDDIIRKKAGYLSKLTTDTLLIVPDLKLSPEKSDLLIDALGQIGCRAFFVTENVPKHVSDCFPTFSVGRMDDNCLCELFFHYYTKADPNQAELISDSLISFLPDIGGHTKSVEIIAKALGSDPILSPDDVPRKIAELGSFESGSLSDNVFSLLSGVFDMQDIPESEKKILMYAALLCRIPMSLTSFADFLDNDTVFNKEAVEDLIEKSWLTVDYSSSVVSVEPFVARMCLSKNKPDADDIAAVFEFFYNRFGTVSITASTDSIFYSFKRFALFADALGCTGLHDMAILAIRCLSVNVSDELSNDALTAMKLRAMNEVTKLCPELPDETDYIIHTLYSVILAQTMFESGMQHGMDSDDLVSFYMNSFSSELESAIGSLIDLFEVKSFDPLVNVMRGLALSIRSGDLGVIYSFILDSALSCRHFALESARDTDVYSAFGDGDEDEPDMAAIMASSLLYLEVKLIPVLFSNDYVRLKILRAIVPLLDIGEDELEVNTSFEFYNLYYSSLINVNASGEELDTVYNELYGFYSLFRNELFETPGSMAQFIEETHRSYIMAMISGGRSRKAQEIYFERYLPDVPVSEKSCDGHLTLIGKISDSHIRAGEPFLCASFIEKALSKTVTDICLAKKDSDPGMYEYYTVLKDEAYILTHGAPENDFTDGANEYLDYYISYPESIAEKLSMSAYRKIADRTDDFDFSSLRDDEFAAETERLRKKAKTVSDWKKLAPEVFALADEAGSRILGYRCHFVQFLGAAAMADGKIAEMRNGEGKTHTIVLAAYLKAIFGKKVRIVDSSIYLAERNYYWMHGLYEILGLKICLLTNERIDRDTDYALMRDSDVVYETEIHLAFSFLNYDIGDHRTKPEYRSLIADEADMLLVTNALQQYSVNRTSHEKNDNDLLDAIWDAAVDAAGDGEMYHEYNGAYSVTESFIDRVLAALHRDGRIALRDEQSVSDSVSRNAPVALAVLLEYENGKQYHIYENNPVRENALNGSFVGFGRSTDYFIRKKEGLPQKHSDGSTTTVINECSVIEIVKQFDDICGATATASSLQKELRSVYGLDVVRIPPNVPVRSDNHPAEVFPEEGMKTERVLELVAEKHSTGQPVLVITGSIYDAERIARKLKRQDIPCSVISAKNSAADIGSLISAGEVGKVTVGTPIANRGVDILLGGNPYEMTEKMLRDAGIPDEEIKNAVYGYNTVINGREKYKELYDKYNSLLALNKSLISEAKAEVERLGGLCVIGTECFNDLRTEQQVRGRQGRQGAPGESYILYSLEDDSLRPLLGNRYETVTNYLKMAEIDNLSSNILNNAINKGRIRIQESSFSSITENARYLYHREARKVFNDLIDRSREGEDAFRDIVQEYFSCDPEIQRRIEGKKSTEKAPSALGDISAIRSVRNMSRLISERYESAREKARPGIITDGYFEYLGKNGLTEENGAYIFRKEMEKSFERYFADFGKSYESMTESSFADAKKKKMIGQFNMSVIKRTVRTAIERIMLYSHR